MASRSLLVVQGSPLEICGTSRVRITLSEEEFDTEVVVAEAIITQVILGRDFLRENSCTIDVGKNLISFAGRGIALSMDSRQGSQQVAFVSVMVDSAFNIPAYSEMEIMAKVPMAATKGSWIVEGSDKERNAVLVARGLVTPAKQEVPIRVSRKIQ